MRLKRIELPLLFISVAFLGLFLAGPAVKAAAYDSWGQEPTRSPEGVYYTQYIEFIVTRAGSEPVYNVPLEINPTFEDGTCNYSSLRILYLNPTTLNYTELPYQNTSIPQFYPSGYLKTVNLTFVLPKLEASNKFRLYWTYNYTGPTKIYNSSDYVSLRAPNVTRFYRNGQLYDNVPLRFNKTNSWINDTGFLMVGGSGEYNTTIISATLKFIGKPNLNTSDSLASLDLGPNYRNKGPISIKLVSAASMGWTDINSTYYLLVGTHDSLIIYRRSWGNLTWQYITAYNYSSDVQCYGLAAGDVINDATGEILVGLGNGTVAIFTFDGTTLTPVQNIRNSATALKAWGLGLIDIAYGDGQYEVFVASANPYTYQSGDEIFYNETEGGGSLKTMQTTPATYPGNYHDTTGYIWGPNVYIDNFMPDTDYPGNEIMIASRYNGYLTVMLGNASCIEQTGDASITTGGFQPTGSAYSWYYVSLAPYYGIDEMSAVAYSKYLNPDTTMNTLVAATDNGKLYYFNMSYNTGTKKIEVVSDPSYEINFGRYGAIFPVIADFDGVDTPYEDVVGVSSNGYMYFIKYNTTDQHLYKSTEMWMGPNIDFAGVGQSAIAADLYGDTRKELVVAGSDGIIRSLSTFFPSDIKIDVTESGTDNGPGTVGLNQYTEETTNDFSTEISNYISGGNYQTVYYEGHSYILVPINVSTTTPGFVELYNLEVVYNTSDYSIVEKNKYVNPFDTTLATAKWVYLDNDHDNYPDVYEHLGKAYIPSWAGTEVPYYLDDNGVPTGYLRNNDPLPSVYHLDPWNNDSDGDGVADGDEILLYYTNPSDNDTDHDNLSDWDELFGPYSGLLGEDCAVNPDYDGDGLNDYIEIHNHGNPKLVDTDGDGLNDTVEYYKYHSDLNNTDSDGDGLPDLEESGSVPGHILYNIIFGYIREYVWNETPGAVNLNLTDPDTDGDGISDYDEIYGYNTTYWFGGKTYTYMTDPRYPDTDGDGLTDGQEVLGAQYTIYQWQFDNNPNTFRVNITTLRTDPQSVDTDGDGLKDSLEITYHTSPLLVDTDDDGLTDGAEALRLLSFGTHHNLELNATDPDTDNDNLTDGTEYYGLGYVVGRGSDPTMIDTDGDTLSDWVEVTIEYTDPDNIDSDGDGLRDDVDPMPMLSSYLQAFTTVLMIASTVLGVLVYPINKKAAKVAVRAKLEYKKTINKIVKRLDRERREMPRVTAFARMMPSNLESGKINVKINVRINDESFLVRQVKLWYSAGADTFKSVMMDKIDDRNYSIVLADIPLDITVLYYLELLDKTGVWVKQLRDEEQQLPFEFSTGKDGVKEPSDWEDPNLIRCDVCGYMCRKDWDECPECHTPLHVDTQEIFLEEQIKKEEKLKKEMDSEELAWQEAQQTDEFWRGLPECPSCGFTVQPDWATCPVCGFDLTSVELKPKAVYADVETDMDYIEGKEEPGTYYDDTGRLKKKEEKGGDEAEEIRKRKHKDEDEWSSADEDIDIL